MSDISAPSSIVKIVVSFGRGIGDLSWPSIVQLSAMLTDKKVVCCSTRVYRWELFGVLLAIEDSRTADRMHVMRGSQVSPDFNSSSDQQSL